MSQTLGEKLRHAREERGISISEVAEQTRISALYIESIENDNYKPLPGGIFNKGFLKSYAKFIGVDEQEALSDYARIAAESESISEPPLKVYRPEVLTDDNSSSSMAPTLIFAGIILALMTGGILFVLNYLQNRESNTANSNANVNTAAVNVANSNAANVSIPSGNAPTMATLKVEFRAASDEISLTSAVDGKSTTQLIAAGGSATFEPKESIKFGYARSRAQSARLLINGKSIILPEMPENPRRNIIEFEINKDNLTPIWNEGRITFQTSGVPANSNLSVPVNSAGNTPVPAATPTRPAATPRPSVAPPVNKPPANKPPPTMQPTIIAPKSTPKPSPN